MYRVGNFIVNRYHHSKSLIQHYKQSISKSSLIDKGEKKMFMYKLNVLDENLDSHYVELLQDHIDQSGGRPDHFDLLDVFTGTTFDQAKQTVSMRLVRRQNRAYYRRLYYSGIAAAGITAFAFMYIIDWEAIYLSFRFFLWMCGI
jgi:hypothetical protein